MSSQTKALGRVLRDLSEQNNIDKQIIRAALIDLTDSEFEKLWDGDRTVYLEEFCTIDLVFAEAGAKHAYPEAAFRALREIHDERRQVKRAAEVDEQLRELDN